MDETSRHYTTSLATLSKDLGRFINDGSSQYALPAVGIHSPGGFTGGGKRKWGSVDGSVHLKDGSSLVIGLGNSSSSCTTTSSGKETEDGPFINLDLSIDLPGNNRVPIPKQVSNVTAEKFEFRRPKLDLELSLSTGPAESDVTTVAQGFDTGWNAAEAPALTTTLQIVDEGSISSRWKCGPLVPPLPFPETVPLVDQVHVHNYQIPVASNVSTHGMATPKELVNGSSVAAPQQQRRTSVKICQFDGCVRGARGASGLCISHGGGRRCQRAGCQKGAEGKTVFCKAHGGGRRCQHLGCTKSAEGRTDYCITHDGGRRCTHEGCTRAARGKSGLCIRHGGGKRCKMENCTKSAEGLSGLCISHGGGRRCRYPDCTKGAQGSTIFCKAHGGGKRCTYLGCTKGAEGSTPFCKGHGGGKRCTSEGCCKSVHGGTLFCVNHGGGKRCVQPGCTKSARGRTNFCVRHGGGKRCEYEGCTKSAQGSTDFCKAHGGGKRCSWGQVGSEFGGQAAIPCDKFARGKSGLCAPHAARVEERTIIASSEMNLSIQDLQCNPVDISSAIAAPGGGLSIGYGHKQISPQMPLHGNLAVGNACLDQYSLPEGRVHGGSLMALLRAGTSFPISNSSVDGQ